MPTQTSPTTPAFVALCVCLLNPFNTNAQETKIESSSPAVNVATEPAPPAKALPAKETSSKGWSPLFNGKDLTGWKVTNFGGEGEVKVEKDHVMIDQGVDLSGITSTRKDLPTLNYEIEFEAQRAAGNDFFIGITFPYKASSCTLICGGWGGGVCGLSSLDGMDASENETTSYLSFTNGQWYKVRLLVEGDRIQAWLDKSNLVDVETTDRKVDVRFETDLSRPMGFSTYQSRALIRNARIRTLPTPAAKSSEKDTK